MRDEESPPLTTAVYLISGIPGAGKTTVARALAKQLPRAAHIEGDAIQNLIVSGGLHPQEEPRAEAQRQLCLRTRNVSLLADSFFEHGVTPVVDDVVAYEDRLQQYKTCIRSRPLVMVVLAPPLEICLARDSARVEKHVGHIWGHLDAVMRRELVDVGLWLDSSGLTPKQTVDSILKRAQEGVIAG